MVVFLVVQRGRFARRPAGNEAVDACGNLLFDKLPHPRLVDFPVSGERRN
jgi:hypothetical protein